MELLFEWVCWDCERDVLGWEGNYVVV